MDSLRRQQHQMDTHLGRRVRLGSMASCLRHELTVPLNLSIEPHATHIQVLEHRSDSPFTSGL
eukprot:3316992-Amphidinium_carterae.1